MANEIHNSTSAMMLNTAANKTSAKNMQDPVNEVRNDARQEAPPQSDRVSVTNDASRLQKIEEQMSAIPEVNSQKVADIKQAIADGTFEIDPGRIAEKLLALETGEKKIV